MKKSVGFVFGILILFFCSYPAAVAAPAYGTNLPKKRDLVIGVQTHFIDERELEDTHGTMQSLQHFLLLSYGVTDWLSLDLKGGAGNIKQTSEAGTELNYASYMAGGYGFRLRFYQSDDITFVFGFQHISVHPYQTFLQTKKYKAVLDDWQFTFLGSKTFGENVDVYAGAKWSRMDYIRWENDKRKRIQSDLGKSVGAVLGVDIPLKDRWKINMEAQFIDVQAYSFNIQYSF
ncbi:MAG: hypothetical protein KC713_05050 [Candidatus Omnitrophica bacterium]|nr:hypothetical protein [Candidatus Omnitrophota bacterium]